MLIARSRSNKADQNRLLIGLTKEERKRLDAGEPLRLPPCRMPATETALWIFGGHDQEALVDELERVLGGGAEIELALVVR
jgi:hypothetical protein